jgi:8-oxo-dGTP pyrophosphatase MutT (NUDIX family)
MIPPNATKVFSGVLFDVYQWPQKMFDGTITTFERLKRQDTAEVIAIKDGKIMLEEQEQPCKPLFLCLPGGRIEYQEEPVEGAKRELREESGFVSNDWSLYRTVQPMHKIDWYIHVFVARDCIFQEPTHLDNGEHIVMRWVTFDELLNLVDDGKLAWIEQNMRVEFIRAKYHPPARAKFETIFFQ